MFITGSCIKALPELNGAMISVSKDRFADLTLKDVNIQKSSLQGGIEWTDY